MVVSPRIKWRDAEVLLSLLLLCPCPPLLSLTGTHLNLPNVAVRPGAGTWSWATRSLCQRTQAPSRQGPGRGTICQKKVRRNSLKGRAAAAAAAPVGGLGKQNVTLARPFQRSLHSNQLRKEYLGMLVSENCASPDGNSAGSFKMQADATGLLQKGCDLIPT